MLKNQILDTENQLFEAQFEFCYWVEKHEIFQLENASLILNDWQDLKLKFWNGIENQYDQLAQIPNFEEEISEGIFAKNQIVLKGFVQTSASHWGEFTFINPQSKLLYETKVFLRKQEIEAMI